MVERSFLENQFRYHKLTPQQRSRINALRETALGYSLIIDQYCPDGREKDLAIIRLQEASMWANKAVCEESEEKTENIDEAEAL